MLAIEKFISTIDNIGIFQLSLCPLGPLDNYENLVTVDRLIISRQSF